VLELLRVVYTTRRCEEGQSQKILLALWAISLGRYRWAAARQGLVPSLAGLGGLGEVLWAALLRCCDAIIRPNQNWRALGA
jgi:hypothetical protein